MVAGFALVALSLAGPRDKVSLAQRATTTVVRSSPYASSITPGTTAPLGTATLGDGFAPLRMGRAPLRGFGEALITVTTGSGKVCRLCVLSAVTTAQRQRGLMEVTDPALGGYDGMLFEFPTEVSGSFWMRNTPQPLSIAYFDAQGDVVSKAEMVPCADSPDCISYPAGAPFQFALEVPAGDLVKSGVVGAATLTIDARTCPLASKGN